MPDNSKITLKQLKNAMNMVKAYIDEQIQGISPNPPEEGATLSISDITGGTFTTSDTVAITYTTSKAVTKHEFVMNYSGADSGFTDGTARVISSGNNHTMTFNPGELSAGTKNGAIKVTDADGNTAIAQFTLVITEGSITPEPTPVLYELAVAKTFNGTTDYLDTGVCLLTGDNLNKDWTMLIDFTPTSINQASIIHCMTEASGWPGLYLSILNNTGNIQMVFPNNSANNNIVTVTANQRVKFVIKKVGNTFTVYDSTMSSLHTNTPSTINTTPNTVLLGAIQVYSATQGKTTYSRFFKGTIHRFKIVEGNMSDEDCLSWTTDSPTDDNYTLLCGNLDYTGRGNGAIMGTGDNIVPMVFRRDFDTSNHTTLCSNKTIKRICLRIDKAGKLTIGKVDLTQQGKNINATIIDPVEYDVIVGLNTLDVNISCGAHESLAIGAVGDTGLPLFSYTALTPEQVKGFPVSTNEDFKSGINVNSNVALLGAIYI